MPEPVCWLPDGTPHSPRFGERYRSAHQGGLAQACQTFVGGCALPASWAQAAHWRVLEIGFGLGLNFLATWAAWRGDPQRPRLLHYVALEAFPVSAHDVLRNAAPPLHALAQALAQQLHGLLPGVHRLVFEQGQVLLTLHVGPAQRTLRQQAFTVDSVYLDGFSPPYNPELWHFETLKAMARHCRRGTRLATWCVARSVRETLAQLGFAVQRVPGAPPKRHNLQACYDPPWQPRSPRPRLYAPHTPPPRRCLVLGAGIAGAAAAASLARRGWQVTVLDAGAAPAAAASGLPAGLFCPHASPDDAPLSRLSRAGVRQTLAQLQQLTAQGRLRRELDWAHCGVLEHGVARAPRPAYGASASAAWWSRAASAQQRAAAHLPHDAPALWHAQAGWVRPARLVQALLALPGVQWRGGCAVARLHPDGAGAVWQALDATERVLAEAQLVVLAAGTGSAALLRAVAAPAPAGQWPLQALRGQISWGQHTPASVHAMPPFPVNGHGSLLPALPQPGAPRPAWVAGSTFERTHATQVLDTAAQAAAGHAANAARLARLLPHSHAGLRDFFAAPLQPTWCGVRCAAPDRLPLVGPVAGAHGVYVLTALGARGLTLALLCAELLAARLHHEPLPLDARLAAALDSGRFRP